MFRVLFFSEHVQTGLHKISQGTGDQPVKQKQQRRQQCECFMHGENSAFFDLPEGGAEDGCDQSRKKQDRAGVQAQTAERIVPCT